MNCKMCSKKYQKKYLKNDETVQKFAVRRNADLKPCRARKMLKNAPTLAIGGADPAENGPSKVRQVSNKIRHNIGYLCVYSDWTEWGPCVATEHFVSYYTNSRVHEEKTSVARRPQFALQRATGRIPVNTRLRELNSSPDELSTVRPLLYRRLR